MKHLIILKTIYQPIYSRMKHLIILKTIYQPIYARMKHLIILKTIYQPIYSRMKHLIILKTIYQPIYARVKHLIILKTIYQPINARVKHLIIPVSRPTLLTTDRVPWVVGRLGHEHHVRAEVRPGRVAPVGRQHALTGREWGSLGPAIARDDQEQQQTDHCWHKTQ